jgi:hypothetical protein
MEKKFTSVEELDSYLEENFKVDGVEIDEESDPMKVETEDTIEDLEVEEDDDAELVSEDDEETEEDEEGVEEEAPKPAKRSKEEKRDYAFSKLRKEASDAKKAAEEYNHLVTRLMKEAGYSDYSEFKNAVDQQLSEKEMKAKGYTKEQYSEIENLRRQNKELNDALEQRSNREKYERARSFDSTVSRYADEYKMSAKDIYENLEKLGYTADMLLAQPNPEILIKGLLVDKAKPAPKPAKKSVDTEKLSAGATKTTGVDLDELIKKDLAEYKSRKGLA